MCIIYANIGNECDFLDISQINKLRKKVHWCVMNHILVHINWGFVGICGVTSVHGAETGASCVQGGPLHIDLLKIPLKTVNGRSK